MRAALPALVVLAALLAVAVPVPAPSHPDMEGPPGGGAGKGGMVRAEEQQGHGARAWGNLTEGQRNAATQRAEQARLFARMTADDGEGSGRFVRFGYDNATGDLRDVTALDPAVNATFFTRVHPASWGGNVTELLHGGVFRLASDAGSVAVHNNPGAHLALRGSNLTVTFDVAPNVAQFGDLVDNRTVRLNAASGGHGHLLIAGNGTLRALDNDTYEAVVTDGAVLFKGHPGSSAHGVLLHERLDAIAAGTLGGEVNVVEGEGGLVQDGESYGVTLRAERGGNGTLRVRADSADPRGRAVVLRTDNLTLPAGRPDEVRVLLDGVALPAAPATDLLNGTHHGRANVSFAGGAITVLVGIGSFSEHVVELQSTAASPTTPPPPPTSPPPATTPPPTTPPPPNERGSPGASLLMIVAGVVLLAFALRRR